MKHKWIALLLAAALTLTAASGCAAQEEPQPPAVRPELTQMRAICELAVMECYYHNVAKFLDEDAEGLLWWQKDKHFWIEYSGVVRLGIDASLVKMDVRDDDVTITVPRAKILSCTVDENSLNEDSFIVDKESAAITADDEIKAFDEAQRRLEETAANDTALLANAQDRAMSLLKEYVDNIGSAAGRTYTVEFRLLEDSGKNETVEPAPESSEAEPAAS